MSQELSISKDKKILAICDLSNNESVLEIKTFKTVLGCSLDENVEKQLYYQANGRKSYVLELDFVKSNDLLPQAQTIDELTLRIFEVTFNNEDESKIIHCYELNDKETELLNYLELNPYAKKIEIRYKLKISQTALEYYLKTLQDLGYLAFIKANEKKHCWRILRDADDFQTFYKEDSNGIHII